MKTITSFNKPKYPVRIVQFGEGNFLRAFIEPMVERANEEGRFGGSIAVVKPTARGNLDRFARQNCLYTVLLRGLKDGTAIEQARLIRCIDRAFDPSRDEEAFQKLAAEPALQYCISNTT